MKRRLHPPALVISLIYLTAIAVTTALLVFWVLVVQRFAPEINQLAAKVGVRWGYFHWFIQTSGAGLFFLVLVALTYLLAASLSHRRYAEKQEEFLSTISHELKSPVAAIQLHAQTLQQADVAATDRRRSVGFIVREAQRIGQLVDNLLDSSRLLAGKSAGDPRPIDLDRFFRGYRRTVGGRFDLSRVELTFELRTRAVVEASAEGLQRVMDNLIANALRFTPDGGKIRCSVRDRVGEAEIVVVDDGVGIPKRELPKIFDRFYSQERDPRGRRRRGTGLGLAIVRQLVEEMRGQIRAISGDDEPGTRFEIHLPKARVSRASRATGPDDESVLDAVVDDVALGTGEAGR